tara:strand:+ start:4020 stop:4469 length:450 start_codon:yes stop_codon:yes gene_type:complete
MTRLFADFSRPAPAPWRWTDTVLVALGILFLMVHPAGARDLGQWKDADQHIGQWYRSLMQPDNPNLSCCGKADAYWADKVETGPNGEMIAVITDDRPDEPLGRRHVPPGTRIVVPKNKIKFDQGNPTGHIVIFLTPANEVWCYVQNGGV